MNHTLPVKQPVCFHRSILVGIAVLFSGFVTSLTAQQYFTAEKTYAVKLGTTKPLYELANAFPTDSIKLKERKANKPRIIPNFRSEERRVGKECRSRWST